MLGAIIGDIVGSRFEFNSTNDYNFELFTDKCGFTDDTICTCAIADALLKGKDFGESLHEWCRLYPHPKGSYGGRFAQWVYSDNPKPYGSFGNGSAMRVSPVGWLCRFREDILKSAEHTANCTHNHPEGIKGAQTVALAIYVANTERRCNKPTADIVKNVIKECVEFSGYNIDIHKKDVENRFDETCQGTVPVALWIINQSNGFEDAIRRAVSLGADADTLGAIVGSIAEAIWGIPEEIKVSALSYLDDRMKDLLHKWRRSKLIKGTILKSEMDMDYIKFNELLEECSAYEIVMFVHYLHQRGYEQMRLYAGMSPSGMSWRWAIYPKVFIQTHFDFEHGSDGTPFQCVFGSTGEDYPRRRDLVKFDDLFNELKPYVNLAKGKDPEYVEWFQTIVDHAENRDFPIAYCEYFEGDSWMFLMSKERLKYPPYHS